MSKKEKNNKKVTPENVGAVHTHTHTHTHGSLNQNKKRTGIFSALKEMGKRQIQRKMEKKQIFL